MSGTQWTQLPPPAKEKESDLRKVKVDTVKQHFIVFAVSTKTVFPVQVLILFNALQQNIISETKLLLCAQANRGVHVAGGNPAVPVIFPQ